MNVREPDDHLHNPDPKRDRHYDAGGSIFTARGIANLGCLLILVTGMLLLLFVCFKSPLLGTSPTSTLLLVLAIQFIATSR